MHPSTTSLNPSEHSWSAVARHATPPRVRSAACKAYSGPGSVAQAKHTTYTRRALQLHLGVAASFATLTRPGLAADFILPFDSTQKLPSGYQDLTRRLVTALQDAVSADVDGASENEVRRKADPAKGLVKEWVTKWRDNRLVRGAESHDQLSAMLQELGTYYQKNGARSRMTKDIGSSLLDKLKAAEASLPPVEAKKKGLFG